MVLLRPLGRCPMLKVLLDEDVVGQQIAMLMI
jgi:hypothetical protein